MKKISIIPFTIKQVGNGLHSIKVLDYFPKFIVQDIYAVTQANKLNRIRKHKLHNLILIGQNNPCYLRIYDGKLTIIDEIEISDCVIFVPAQTIFSLRFEALSCILVLSDRKHDINELVYYD